MSLRKLFGSGLVEGRGLEVRALDEGGGPAEILIYEVVGEFYDWKTNAVRGIDAQKILGAIQDLAGRDILVRINSPGGLVTEGVAIYNALRRHQLVDVAIDGQAGSIASVIAMAGRKRSMAENATMMIHAASVFAAGNASELRKVAEALDRVDESLLATYVRRTGQAEDQVRSWMQDETYMTAAEALERGFVDELVDGLEVVAAAELTPQARQALRARDVEALQVEGAAELLLERKRQAEEATAAATRAQAELAARAGVNRRRNLLRVLEAETGL